MINAVSSLGLVVVFVGIICLELTLAQPSQLRLTPGSRSSRRRFQQSFRFRPPGPSFHTRGLLQPGSRHTLVDRSRETIQHHSGVPSRIVDRSPIPTGSNRLRTATPRRRSRPPASSRAKALHIQPRPTGTSVPSPKQSPSQSKPVTASSRRSPGTLRIFARNLKVVNGNNPSGPKSPQNPKSKRQPIAPMSRTPLRIRARLRQISSETSPRQPAGKSNPSKIKNGNGSSSNSRGGKKSRRDMIAVDDIIALVNAIRGNKDPSPTKTPTRSVTSTRNSGLINREKSPKREGKTPGLSTSGGRTGLSKSPSARKGQGDTTLNLLTHFALMNNNEGLLKSLMSDPMFMEQMVSLGGSSMLTEPSSLAKSVPIGSRNGKKSSSTLNPKGSVVIHPSLLQRVDGSSSSTLINTGNPVQDKMVSALMAQTMKHMREEIRENMNKGHGETETTAITGADNSGDAPVIVG